MHISTFKHFIIPTLGRIDKQVTYNNLPQKYQAMTTFVVQAHEYAEMREKYPGQVLVLPAEINRLAPTREWIFNQFNTTRHFVFDDDLTFIVKQPNPNPGSIWLTHKFTEQDFDDAFALFNKWMDEGIIYGNFQTTTIMPNVKRWPFADCGRTMTNVFYDGEKVPRDLQWNRAELADDLDVNLQLLTQGFKNRVSTKYLVMPSPTQAKGGCEAYRTLDVHNAAQQRLAELWPDYVKIKEKLVKTGPWAGLTKLNLHISNKKAYKDAVKRR